METWINRFSRARLKMEKLAYYLLQPLRPEKWKTQGAPYLVLRKNEGLNAEKLTNHQFSYPGVFLNAAMGPIISGDHSSKRAARSGLNRAASPND